jgi:DNA ligase-1
MTLFSMVADVFNEIEQVSSRLVITQKLGDLFKKLTPKETNIVTNLSLGVLHPAYIGTQFSLAEKAVIDLLAELLNISHVKIIAEQKKLGDLGLVAESFLSGSQIEKTHDSHVSKKHNTGQKSIDFGSAKSANIDIYGAHTQKISETDSQRTKLTITKVYEQLSELEATSGTGSTEVKAKLLLKLLQEFTGDTNSIKLILRIISGKLRLGFSDMTIVDSLSYMLVDNKTLRAEIEHAYNLSADIGHVAEVAKSAGIDGVRDMKIILGIPIRPAAAERLNSPEEIIARLGCCAAQPKLDGFRLQIHIDHKKIKFFSRNLLDMSEMFPDLVHAFKDFKVDNLICEGEALVYDESTGSYLPFQETVRRKRKHGISEMAAELPLKLVLFDILYLNGQELLSKTHTERREILKDLLVENLARPEHTILLVDEHEICDPDELEKYFLENITAGLEGLVVKKLDATYQPGKRNFNWIKLKRHETGHLDDTLDCVILGYYHGQGKRAKFGIGAFLVGLFNKTTDSFQTVAKVGTGLTDVEWVELRAKCDKLQVQQQPKNVDCDKNLAPDVWVSPELICLIRADEITKSPIHRAGQADKSSGYALRFPRFMGYREDKSALEATTTEELIELYNLQYK